VTYDEAVLHLTAGMLSADFAEWEIRNENGTPFAHFAAMHSLLPAGFDGWEIANEDGVTTLRVLLCVGADVPEGFDEWFRLIDGRMTFIECARHLGNEKLVAKFEAWKVAQKIAQGAHAGRSVRPLIRRPSV